MESVYGLLGVSRSANKDVGTVLPTLSIVNYLMTSAYPFTLADKQVDREGIRI
jgi:hypothetical protein